MNDNYFLDDMIGSLEKDIVMERYYPLIEYKQELIAILNKTGTARKDQVSDAVIEDIRMMLGEAVSGLFSRFIHIYDFNNIRRENRSEIIPQPKEVNCHREVAKMILNTDERQICELT